MPLTSHRECHLRQLAWAWNRFLLAEADSQTSSAGKSKSAIFSVPLGLKVHLSLKIFKLLLAAQLVVLSGDVMLNPGPLHSEFVCPSEQLGFCNESFSSLDSESDGHVSFASQFNSSMDSLDYSEPHLYFNLNLPSFGTTIKRRVKKCQ